MQLSSTQPELPENASESLSEHVLYSEASAVLNFCVGLIPILDSIKATLMLEAIADYPLALVGFHQHCLDTKILHLHAQADVEIIDVALREHLAASVLGFAAAGGSDASQAARWDGQGVPPHVLHSIQSGLATGFQLAAAAGPLCDEPMWGIAFEVRISPLQHGLKICRHSPVGHIVWSNLDLYDIRARSSCCHSYRSALNAVPLAHKP